MKAAIKRTANITAYTLAIAFIVSVAYFGPQVKLTYHASLGNQEQLFAPPQEIAMNELHAQEAAAEAKHATKLAKSSIPTPQEKPPVPAKVDHPAFGGL